VSQFAVIVGPGMSGILYSFGPTLVYGLTSAFLLISSMLIAKISIKKEKIKQEPASFKSFFAGISFIKSSNYILPSFVYTWCF
jgi:hypothetical protein